MSQCYLNLKRAVDSNLSAIINERDTCLLEEEISKSLGSDEGYIKDVIVDLGIKACMCVLDSQVEK